MIIYQLHLENHKETMEIVTVEGEVQGRDEFLLYCYFISLQCAAWIRTHILEQTNFQISQQNFEEIRAKKS